MKNFFINLYTASRIVLNDKNYLAGFLIVAVGFFWLFLYIPVRIIPGNDFAFQLSILRPNDIFLLVLLSLLSALSLTFHFYMLRRKSVTKSITLTIGGGFLGGTAGIVGSLFATASCAACVATLLSFLGVGTVFFLLGYRQLIITFSIVLMLVSLHFTARKVLGICDVCSIDYKRKKYE